MIGLVYLKLQKSPACSRRPPKHPVDARRNAFLRECGRSINHPHPAGEIHDAADEIAAGAAGGEDHSKAIREGKAPLPLSNFRVRMDCETLFLRSGMSHAPPVAVAAAAMPDARTAGAHRRKHALASRACFFFTPDVTRAVRGGIGRGDATESDGQGRSQDY